MLLLSLCYGMYIDAFISYTFENTIINYLSSIGSSIGNGGSGTPVVFCIGTKTL